MKRLLKKYYKAILIGVCLGILFHVLFFINRYYISHGDYFDYSRARSVLSHYDENPRRYYKEGKAIIKGVTKIQGKIVSIQYDYIYFKIDAMDNLQIGMPMCMGNTIERLNEGDIVEVWGRFTFDTLGYYRCTCNHIEVLEGAENDATRD